MGVGWTAEGHKDTSGVNGNNFLYLVLVVSQADTSLKTHGNVFFKWAQFVGHKFYHNTVIKKP